MSTYDALALIAPPRAGGAFFTFRGTTWREALPGLIGAGAGFALLRRSHPVLGILNGAAIGGNIAGLARREIDPRESAENLASHAIATGASLAFGGPSGGSALGYVGGAIGSAFLFRKPGKEPGTHDYKFIIGATPVGGYKDPGMVRLFQAQVVALNSMNPALRLGARMWPPTPEEYDRIVDGVLGPKTKDAARAWNKTIGREDLGDAITDATMRDLPSVTVIPKADAPKKSGARPLEKPSGKSSGAIFQPLEDRVSVSDMPVWKIAAIFGGALAGAVVLGTGIYLLAEGG